MEWVALLMLLIVAISVVVGLGLKNSRKHRATRAEELALKTSGAFGHRKSNLD